MHNDDDCDLDYEVEKMEWWFGAIELCTVGLKRSKKEVMLKNFKRKSWEGKAKRH